jgi:hypothetical protein
MDTSETYIHFTDHRLKVHISPHSFKTTSVLQWKWINEDIWDMRETHYVPHLAVAKLNGNKKAINNPGPGM